MADFSAQSQALARLKASAQSQALARLKASAQVEDLARLKASAQVEDSVSSRVRAMLEAEQKAGQTYERLFNINVPPAPKSILGSLATLPATRPANHEWITPDRQPSPREPSSPRTAAPPPSPQDAAMQALQNMIDLADQREAYLQQVLQRRHELAEKLQDLGSSQNWSRSPLTG